jgi:hypothetical protein
MVTPTRTGWELEFLKRMGRKVVIHYRGCEIRDRERNMTQHPAVNICQQCDYNPYICKADHNVLRRRLAAEHGDAFLVTTPDLRDFAPSAAHMPFFSPPDIVPPPHAAGAGEFSIVHATNHPGIEGTDDIQGAIERLVARGHRIRFVRLHNVPHEEVMRALASADLAIGKMKMGFYANAQIESMAAGVPTITSVRQEYMTPELAASGFIFTSLDQLDATLEYYLTHPEALQQKRALARASILALHDNREISRQYAELYAALFEARHVG